MRANLRCEFTVVRAFFFLCPQGDIQGKRYTLINVPVHGEQTEPNSVFVACLSHEL